ncbi:MAG: hypothetical protein QF805_27195, partial [Pirellulaceae bacterium]|nr:hypothetical protein [Pirellulaceae bacterium]
IDGKEATRRLRQRPEFAELPILAATAHAIKEEDLAIRAAGVTDIVTKPIDEDLFVATMRKLVDHTAETSHGARLSR